jgi:hypothetical protein
MGQRAGGRMKVRGWLWFALAATITLAIYTIIEQKAELARYKLYGGKLSAAFLQKSHELDACEVQRFIDTVGEL